MVCWLGKNFWINIGMTLSEQDIQNAKRPRTFSTASAFQMCFLCEARQHLQYPSSHHGAVEKDPSWQKETSSSLFCTHF